MYTFPFSSYDEFLVISNVLGFRFFSWAGIVKDNDCDANFFYCFGIIMLSNSFFDIFNLRS